MERPEKQPDWLKGYADDYYDWCRVYSSGRSLYYRRIGIVEGLFDNDGTEFEGRADLNISLRIEVRTTLDHRGVYDHILKAWSILRQRHILLSSRVITRKDLALKESSQAPYERIFVHSPSATVAHTLRSGAEHFCLVEDAYANVDATEFYQHLMNTARPINPSEALAKIFVMPIRQTIHDTLEVHVIIVAAHQISDGLTLFRWMSAFIDLVNLSDDQLTSLAGRLVSSDVGHRLPPAQESLYPTINGNQARRRWFWLLTRILRYTQTPPPASFQNPLRRVEVLDRSRPMPLKYSSVLDYTRIPPINSFVITATLSTQATQRLVRLCREANVSLGSGSFTLVGMVMMLFEEKLNPNIPLADRLPFVGSFPVNPRPFLSGVPTTGKEDSLMLAFSNGITLPFLSEDLDFEARFRFLSRQAHRQLRQYQKRKRTAEEEASLGTKSPSRLLPSLYLSTLERLESRQRPAQRLGWNIQGEFQPKLSPTQATCGISSVGDRTNLISAGKYDVSRLSDGQNLVADFRDLQSIVRSRNDEFLVGAIGDKDHQYFSVSYDGCAIDPAMAEEWKQVIEDILEPTGREHKL